MAVHALNLQVENSEEEDLPEVPTKVLRLRNISGEDINWTYANFMTSL
jgi:hypothetical protein